MKKLMMAFVGLTLVGCGVTAAEREIPSEKEEREIPSEKEEREIPSEKEAREILPLEKEALALGEGRIFAAASTADGEVIYSWLEAGERKVLLLGMDGARSSVDGAFMADLLQTSDGRFFGCHISKDGLTGYLSERKDGAWGEPRKLGSVEPVEAEAEDCINYCWSKLYGCALMENAEGEVLVSFVHEQGEDQAYDHTVLTLEDEQLSALFKADEHSMHGLGWNGEDSVVAGESRWSGNSSRGPEFKDYVKVVNRDTTSDLIDDALLIAHVSSPARSAIAVASSEIAISGASEYGEVRVFDDANGPTLGEPLATFEAGLEELELSVIGGSVVIAARRDGKVFLQVDGLSIPFHDAASIHALVPAGDNVHLIYDDADGQKMLKTFACKQW